MSPQGTGFEITVVQGSHSGCALHGAWHGLRQVTGHLRAWQPTQTLCPHPTSQMVGDPLPPHPHPQGTRASHPSPQAASKGLLTQLREHSAPHCQASPALHSNPDPVLDSDRLQLLPHEQAFLQVQLLPLTLIKYGRNKAIYNPNNIKN